MLVRHGSFALLALAACAAPPAEAVYTPAALDARGRIYALNNGELFVIGD